MKDISLIAIVLLIVSCGGTESEELEITDDTLSLEDVVAVNEEELEEEPIEFIPANEDGNWQIDDYAEMFVGGKIAETAEESSFVDGTGWYYRTLDKDGGFAEITGAIEGWNEYVIWRMEDGDDLIGTMSAGCGPACEYAFTFYKGKGENAKQVSLPTIMPVAEIEAHKKFMVDKITKDEKYNWIEYPEDAQLYFRFPKKGTTMEVDLIMGADEMQTKILDLTWDKKKFAIKKKYSSIKEML
jgi:hypothetical protein